MGGVAGRNPDLPILAWHRKQVCPARRSAIRRPRGAAVAVGDGLCRNLIRPIMVTIHMELVRYRPGEAMRWLSTAAENERKSAAKKGRSLVRREGHRTVGRDLGDAAGALLDMGKSAWADLVSLQANATEYVFLEDAFEVIKATGVKRVPYSDVTHIARDDDRIIVELTKGSVTIKPHAYIVAGRVRVPIGWTRNGLEVPYELMIDELAARCGHEVEDR